MKSGKLELDLHKSAEREINKNNNISNNNNNIRTITTTW